MRPILLIAAGLCAMVSAAGAEVAWETDWKRAKRRAALEGKLIFLDFYGDS